MIEKYNFRQLMRVQHFLLQFPPDTDLKKLFRIIDEYLFRRAHDVDDIINTEWSFNTNDTKDVWNKYILKSHALADLFYELENICALDQS